MEKGDIFQKKKASLDASRNGRVAIGSEFATKGRWNFVQVFWFLLSEEEEHGDGESNHGEDVGTERGLFRECGESHKSADHDCSAEEVSDPP